VGLGSATGGGSGDGAGSGAGSGTGAGAGAGAGAGCAVAPGTPNVTLSIAAPLLKNTACRRCGAVMRLALV
jgi:hypothetical protein